MSKAAEAELPLEQILGDGRDNILGGHISSPAEILVGSIAKQRPVERNLTSGFPQVEQRVVASLGGTYKFDEQRRVLVRTDDFSFIMPPPPIQSVKALLVNGQERERFVTQVEEWIEAELKRGEEIMVEKSRDLVTATRRGGLGLLRFADRTATDFIKARAEIYPWLVVLATKGDPIQQQDRLDKEVRERQIDVATARVITFGVENVMRYVLSGKHKNHSLPVRWLIAQLSKNDKIDRAMDLLGTLQLVNPKHMRNAAAVIAGDFLKDINESTLTKPLHEYNLAEDMLLADRMYSALVSKGSSPREALAAINYAAGIHLMLERSAKYGDNKKLYQKFAKKVVRLMSLSEEQLSRVPDGANRLLMGRQIVEAIKATRVMFGQVAT